MNYRPIQLAAVAGNWHKFMARRLSRRFRRTRLWVLRRDRYTCQFCGFQAKDYQEVVNLDNDYSKNSFSNMATACCFCTQCFFIDSIKLNSYGGGQIICLPELTQNELNSFCHVLFCAMINGTSYKSTAQTLYKGFQQRANLMEEKLGEGISNPAYLGQILIEQREKGEKFNENALLKNLRLLPSRSGFKGQIEHWARAATKES